MGILFGNTLIMERGFSRDSSTIIRVTGNIPILECTRGFYLV